MTIGADVVPIRPDTLIGGFLGAYSLAATRLNYARSLRSAFTAIGEHPSRWTEASIVRWCTIGTAGQMLANNTVRGRVQLLRSFLRWCSDQGFEVPDFERAARLTRHSYPATYGKVQSRRPARWLTHDEAFAQLASSPPETLLGLRDRIVLRLGLSGMRVAEIAGLNFSNIVGDELRWIGKGRRPRTVVIGPTLAGLLHEWAAAYVDPAPGSPLIVPSVQRSRPTRLYWHKRISPYTVRAIVGRHAQRAGLGHVAPHDLRRTAAGVLHRSTDANGAHHFDLLDIQKVLGHADPATTMKSYLDPMDTGVLSRAASVLD